MGNKLFEGYPGGSAGEESVYNAGDTQETWVQSLGGEDPLEKEMTTHFSVLGWEIPRTEESSGLGPKGSKKSYMT